MNPAIPTQPGPTLTVSPKSAKFLKDSDWFGKMDPFVRIKIGNDVQKTETAKSQGKTPVWNSNLVYKLTQEQVSQPDRTVILFEMFDEDTGDKAEFLGSASHKLSQIKMKSGDIITLKIADEKNKQVGTLDVAFDFNVPTLPEKISDNLSPTYLTSLGNTQQAGGFKAISGTVAVKLGQGKFDVGVPNVQDLSLRFVHNGIVCVSGIVEGPDRRPAMKNSVIFQLYDGEEMNVKCMKSNTGKEELVGEAQIQTSALSKRDSFHNLPVTFVNGTKKIGEINFEVEFFSYKFENPVRIYNPVQITKGDFFPKKLRYTNPDRVKKNILVQSENKNLVLVKNERFSLNPNETVEIKVNVCAVKTGEEKCRVDVMVEDTHVIEESLLFRIKGV